MKRLLFVMLMTVCSASIASWEQVQYSNEVIVYVDKTTKRKKGSSVEMWVLWNFLETQVSDAGKKYLSQKNYFTHDCRNDSYALISLAKYSDLNGDGVAVSVENFPKNQLMFFQVVPGSIAEATLKIACDKK